VGVLRHPCMCWKVEDYYACLVQAGQGNLLLFTMNGPIVGLVHPAASKTAGTSHVSGAGRYMVGQETCRCR
jgi:hypothetical protein